MGPWSPVMPVEMGHDEAGSDKRELAVRDEMRGHAFLVTAMSHRAANRAASDRGGLFNR